MTFFLGFEFLRIHQMSLFLKEKISGVTHLRAVAQTNRLPFDRLRANGVMLKSCDFSVHAELVEA